MKYMYQPCVVFLHEKKNILHYIQDNLGWLKFIFKNIVKTVKKKYLNVQLKTKTLIILIETCSTERYIKMLLLFLIIFYCLQSKWHRKGTKQMTFIVIMNVYISICIYIFIELKLIWKLYFNSCILFVSFLWRNQKSNPAAKSKGRYQIYCLMIILDYLRVHITLWC